MEHKARILALVALMCSACRHSADFKVPPLADDPVIEKVRLLDFPETVAASGIALGAGAGSELEVSVGAADSRRVSAGQGAVAYLLPAKDPIPCRVSRIVRNVSAETGQGLAWLKPEREVANASGEFVFAEITARVLHHVVTVPKSAIFIKGGHTTVVKIATGKDGKPAYVPTEVRTGTSWKDLVEIKSGLTAEDQTVVEAGIGLVFPDFKASGDD